MENLPTETLLMTRPKLIGMVGSKKLVDEATHSGALPCIKVGKEGSKRPRHLYLREDVQRWLKSLRITAPVAENDTLNEAS